MILNLKLQLAGVQFAVKQGKQSKYWFSKPHASNRKTKKLYGHGHGHYKKQYGTVYEKTYITDTVTNSGLPKKLVFLPAIN